MVLVSGCASTSGVKDPKDPWEGFNRAAYQFNEDVDRTYLKPLATGYRKVLPAGVRKSVNNFFRNLFEPTTIVNDILQGKFQQALHDTGRFMVNTTFGVLGLFDVATHEGIERNEEDFGQTFARWGIGPGPYLVIPFVGPSTVRDGIGLIPYWFGTDPRLFSPNIETSVALVTVDVVDRRSQLLGAGKALAIQLDPYAFLREAYFQKRQNQIYDGEPPLDNPAPQ